MELVRTVAGYASATCLGIAIALSVIDWIVYRINEDRHRSEGCLARLLTGGMLGVSLFFGLLALGFVP